jgi:hypothetical protein
MCGIRGTGNRDIPNTIPPLLMVLLNPTAGADPEGGGGSGWSGPPPLRIFKKHK